MNIDIKTIERKKLIAGIVIIHPRMNAILKKLHLCMQSSAYTREPQCMLVTGPAGVGKTTLIERFQSEYLASNYIPAKSIPILRVEIPEKATIDSVAQEFLERLGDPMSHRGKTAQKISRLKKMLIDRNVRVVIIDEFQNVIDKKTQKAVHDISNFIKSLINQTKIPYFIFGMESCIRVLEEDPEDQLRQRFSVRRTLEPFKWIPGERNSEVITLFSMINELLPFEESSNLHEYDIALKLSIASRGRFRYIMKIIQSAGDHAISNNLLHIPITALSDAFLEEVGTDKLVTSNPFDLTHPQLLDMADKVFSSKLSEKITNLSTVFRN